MSERTGIADERPVLVTGATGFLGGRLADHLADEGVRVRCLVRPHHPDDILSRDDIEVVRGDLTDADAVAAAVEGTQAVFHLAAVVGDWEAREEYERVNVGGSRNVFEAALGAGARVVLASSITVYGERLAHGTCAEDVPHGQPCGPYGATKQRQEELALEFFEAGGDVVVLRLGNIYGPGSRLWVDAAAEHLAGGLPSLMGDGSGDAQLLYVDNAVAALVATGRAEGVSGETYNVVDDSGVTWVTYFSDIARLVGAPAPRRMPAAAARTAARASETMWRALGIRSRPPLTRESVALASSREPIPIERARRDLGYEPQVSYEDGMASVATYLQEQRGG